MATRLLTTAKLKAITEKDVGSILNDGGGLRGRVRRNRSGEITVQFEYKYRNGKKYRTAKVEQWPKHSLAEIRANCREMKANIAKGVDPILKYVEYPLHMLVPCKEYTIWYESETGADRYRLLFVFRHCHLTIRDRRRRMQPDP